MFLRLGAPRSFHIPRLVAIVCLELRNLPMASKIRKDAPVLRKSSECRNLDPYVTLPPKYLQDLYLHQAKYRRKDYKTKNSPKKIEVPGYQLDWKKIEVKSVRHFLNTPSIE